MSSDLSSPPSIFPFDVVEETVRKHIHLSSIQIAKLNTAFTWAVQYRNFEHHTVRYVLMLLSIIFNGDTFNILPQLRTWSGNYPDIALETFYHRPGSWRTSGFVCSDFFEAKAANSKVDPFIQLLKGTEKQHGILHFTRGLLVGIVGLKWRFVEYHLVKIPQQDDPYLITTGFHTNHQESPGNISRPTPSREYADEDYMDLTIKEEANDIINILIWRSQNNFTRDLCYMKRHAEPLPKSLTHSTLDMGIVTDEDKKEEVDQPLLTSEDYGYIAKYLQGQDLEMSETGEVNQEGSMMEED